MPPLADLAATHVEVRALLEDFLEAAVLGETATASRRWKRFDALLRAHAAAEDELLLPRFEALELQTPGCTRALLDAEHRKLERELDAVAALQVDAPEPLPAAQRLSWVRACRLLVELLDHHDQRERAAFFPALDEALPAQEAEQLRVAVCAREDLARAAHGKA